MPDPVPSSREWSLLKALLRDVMKEIKPAWTRMEAAGQLPDGLDANRAKQIWCQFKKKYLADDGAGAGGSLEDEDDPTGNRETGRKTSKNGTRTPSASPKTRRKKKEEEQGRQKQHKSLQGLP